MLNKLKCLINRTLVFFRIVDPFDRNVSITNIALCVVLYKLWAAPEASMVDAGSLMIALSSYSIKKYLNKDSINTAAKVATQITEKAESLSLETKE